ESNLQEEKPVIVPEFTAQIKALKKSITTIERDRSGEEQARPPIWIFCKDRQMARKVHEALSAEDYSEDDLQLIETYEADKKTVRRMSKNNTIFITTPIFGRGVDPQPQHRSGLSTILLSVMGARENHAN
ncbi:unnamed protein product, partial [marine sediment metagenome]